MNDLPEGNNLFEKNLQVLKKYHPNVADQLEKPLPFPLEARCDGGRIPNLYVGEDEGGSRAIYPTPDPLKGIRSFVDSLQGLKGKIVAVFGFALGYYAFALWERYRDSNAFVIFEAIPGSIKLAMTVMDFCPMLSDPRVRIVVDDNIQLDQYLTREEDVVFAYSNPKHITFHPWVRLQEEWYSKAKDALERFIISKKSMNVTLKGSGRLFFKNRHHNLRTLTASTPLTNLRNRFSGYPAVVISSGPSLSKNIHQLRHIKNRALMLAVDSALAPLSRNDVSPDFIVSMDPNRFTYEKLFPFIDKLKQYPLICVPEVAPSILKYLQFDRIFYTYLGNNYQQTFNRLLNVDADFVSNAQSVTHLALHSAQLMGCNPIIFVGLDLAFAGNVDHADGTILHWGNNQATNQDYKVEDIHRRMVPTSAGFLNMLSSCEALIKKTPNRTYIDATEGGAKVGGTQIMPLADVITDIGDRKLSGEELMGAGNSSLPSDVFLKNLENLKHRLSKGKSRIESYFKFVQKIDPYFKKTRCDFQSRSPFPDRVTEWIHQADRLNTEMDQDELNGYLAELLGEFNEAYVDCNKRLFEAEQSRDKEAIFFARYEKQKFVQRIRKDVIDDALIEIEEKCTIVSKLKKRKKAVDAGTGNKSAKLDLATSFFENDYMTEAEAVLKDLLQEEPRAAFLQGCIQVKQGRVAEGLDLIEKASRGADIPISRKRDFLTAVEKEWMDACKPDTPLTFQKLMLERILALNVKNGDNLQDKLQLFTTVANGLFTQNNTGDALVLLNKALETQFTDNPTIMLQLARFLIGVERYDEGLSYLQAAVSLDPAAAVMWEEIGDMLFEGRDYDGALTAYENCCNVLPDRRDVFRKIGDCYAASGRSEAAKVAYETAVKTVDG